MKITDAIKKLESIKKRNPNASVSFKVIGKKYWPSKPAVVSYRKVKKNG